MQGFFSFRTAVELTLSIFCSSRLSLALSLPCPMYLLGTSVRDASRLIDPRNPGYMLVGYLLFLQEQIKGIAGCWVPTSPSVGYVSILGETGVPTPGLNSVVGCSVHCSPSFNSVLLKEGLSKKNSAVNFPGEPRFNKTICTQQGNQYMEM